MYIYVSNPHLLQVSAHHELKQSTTMASPGQPFHFVTAANRSDLFDTMKHDEAHWTKTAFPEFLNVGPSQAKFWDYMFQHPDLSPFQFLAVETDENNKESIIGYGYSMPFFWPELATAQKGSPHTPLASVPGLFESFPQQGFDEIVARGVIQARSRHNGPLSDAEITVTLDGESCDLFTAEAYRIARRVETPNVVSALSITIRPDLRGTGIAEGFIQEMKKATVRNGINTMMVPLRPTRKKEYPWTGIHEYATWTRGENNIPVRMTQYDQSAKPTFNKEVLPHDPWLRKHVRQGAKYAKVIHNSQIVKGCVEDWLSWTGVDIRQEARSAMQSGIDKKTRPPLGEWDGVAGYVEGEKDYVEVLVPDCLVPVRYFPQDDIGLYFDPNIVIYYELWNEPELNVM